MPRRRRTPKARTGSPDHLTPDQRGFFCNSFGQFQVAGGPVLYGGRVVFVDPEEARAAWDTHRETLIEEHEAAHPGEKPWPVETWGR